MSGNLLYEDYPLCMECWRCSGVSTKPLMDAAIAVRPAMRIATLFDQALLHEPTVHGAPGASLCAVRGVHSPCPGWICPRRLICADTLVPSSPRTLTTAFALFPFLACHCLFSPPPGNKFACASAPSIVCCHDTAPRLRCVVDRSLRSLLRGPRCGRDRGSGGASPIGGANPTGCLGDILLVLSPLLQLFILEWQVFFDDEEFCLDRSSRF